MTVGAMGITRTADYNRPARPRWIIDADRRWRTLRVFDVIERLGADGRASARELQRAMSRPRRSSACQDAMIGRTLDTFEILDKLGEGGMGAVYRARDTRLDRVVALKLIRPSELPGRDRVERFKREARAISRLNHPHICALYDIGEHDGEAFLIMELVSGETLASRLERGPLRIEEVLRYGAQIAEALDAAHRNGVVHRDLKPSNIMLTRDGVKLLDFGLAKLRDVDSDRIDKATTMSLALSDDGLILGSLPYMAPEQLEAKLVDARTDLFALGAVLYEMITGEAPFQGSSRASVIVAILSREPVPVSSRHPLTPPLLDRSIQRCLAKAPDDRWQNAADLAAELRWIAESPSRSEPPPLSRRFSILRSRRWQLAAVAGVIAIAGLSAIATAFMWPAPPVPTYSPVTFRHGAVSTARFSPDGQNVIYSASWEGQPYDVFLGHEGSPDARSLGLENGRILSVSPIGDLALVFGRQNMTHFAGVTTLARVPLAGGTRRDLLEHVTEADWIPGSDLLAVVRLRESDGMSVVEFPIGTKVHEAPAAWSLRVSPDGRHVAFFEGPVRFDASPDAAIVMVDRSGKASTLAAGWTGIGLAWNRSGSEILFTATSGVRAPSLHGVSRSGKHRSILDAPDWLVLHDVFRDGRLLLSRNSVRLSITCQAADAAGERDLTWMNGSGVGDLSSDGRTLIFNEELYGAVSGIPEIFRRTLDGAPAVQLGRGHGVSLSPDGKSVLSLLKGNWVLLPTGAGATRTLSAGPVRDFLAGAWLPDGRRIVFAGTESDRDRPRLYVQNVDDGIPRGFTPDGVMLAPHAASPDGSRVLGRAGRDWRLYPIEGDPPQSVPALKAADEPLRWSSDGRSLYVISRAPAWVNARDLVRVDVVTGDRTLVKTLSPADLVGVDNVGAAVITPDGRSYCYQYLRRLGGLFIVDNVK
jgi:serine/threonine protein kinase